MDLAAERFAEQGYHGTSVAEIVQALGVGKGVFYWYFDSKDQLYEEIVKEANADLRRVQREAVRNEDDPVRRIEAAIRSSMTWLGEHRHLFSLIQLSSMDARFQVDLRGEQARSVSELPRHVRDGIVDGHIGGADPEILTHAVIGVVNQLNRVYLARGESSPDLTETAVAFCLGGLLGRIPSAEGTATGA